MTLGLPPVETDLPPAVASTGVKLKVPFICQPDPVLCWAACAAMVLRYYRKPVQLCDVASWLLTSKGAIVDCCSNLASCRQTCDPADVQEIYRNWGVDSIRQGAVTADVLKNELAMQRPIELGTRIGQGGGHLFLVYGWTAGPDGDRFMIYDPSAQQPLSADFNYLCSGMGAWSYTWLQLQKLAG